MTTSEIRDMVLGSLKKVNPEFVKNWEEFEKKKLAQSKP